MKTIYGVALAWDPSGRNDRSGLLIEQLRYAGVLSPEEFPDGKMILTIWCPLPRGSNFTVWQQHNVDRMRSFGLTAEPVTKRV